MDPFLTLHETAGSLLATLLFSAVLFAPGYVAAHSSNLFGFRRLPFGQQCCWAVASSLLLSPIAAYLAGLVLGLSAVTAVMAVAACCCAALLVRQWRLRKIHSQPAALIPPQGLRMRTVAWVLAGWTVFCLLMLVDLQVKGRLFFSVVNADQSYRIAFTDAVVRTGVPPSNPLYFPQGLLQAQHPATVAPSTMPYYFFWYVLCAVVVKMGSALHITSQQAFIASSIWAGFGLLATVHLYTRHFFGWAGKREATRGLTLALLAVTGADLVPALGNVVLQSSLNGDMEWWSVDPIDAWADSLLWVPHHVASALACLLSFLLLWRTRQATDRRSHRLGVVFAAAGFASAFGLSCYVAIGFAGLVAAWLLRLAVLRTPDRWAVWRRLAAAALLAGVLLAPYVLGLLRDMRIASAGRPSSPLFQISVRRMIDSGLLTGLPIFAGLERRHPVLLDQGLRTVLLLPGLAMELGLYGAVLAILYVSRRKERSYASGKDFEAADTALFFTLYGFAMTLFVTSSTISTNDFGYRAVMLPQFFLLLLTAEWLGRWWFRQEAEGAGLRLVTPALWQRRLLYGLFALGVAGSVYGSVLLRAWAPLVARRAADGYSELPQDAAAIQAAFDTSRGVLAPNSVVAFRPVPPEVHTHDEVMTPYEMYQRLMVMHAGQQFLNAEWNCAVHFGGAPSACTAMQQMLQTLYAVPSPGASTAQALCLRFGVQALVISHRDPGWSAGQTARDGWPQTLPVVAQQPGFRILSCAPAGGGPSEGTPPDGEPLGKLSHLAATLTPR